MYKCRIDDESWAHNYVVGRSALPQAVAEIAGSLFGFEAGASVVDIGCGPGRLLALLAQRYRVIGIDTSPAMRRIAMESLREFPGTRTFSTVDEYIEQAQSSTDAFLFSHSLHLLPQVDVLRVLERQNQSVNNVVIWSDRVGDSPYDLAVPVLREEFTIPPSPFLEYYESIDYHLQEIGLSRFCTHEVAYEISRTGLELASYLLSQSHVAPVAASGCSRSLTNRLLELIGSGPHRIQFAAHIAGARKI